MTTEYQALVAIDVPHYGYVDVEAESDAEALTLVKAEARDAPSNAEWDSAHSLRIVHIENDSTGETFAEDLELGDPMAYHLTEDEPLIVSERALKHARAAIASAQPRKEAA